MPFQILAADSFHGSICILVVISEHVQWSMSFLWRQIWSLTRSCMCIYIQYRCSVSLSYSHTDSKTMNVTLEFGSESVIIIRVREKTRGCFSKTVFRLRVWAETIPICVRRKTRSSRKQVSLRLYIQLIDTWHAVHSSHHRVVRSGPDGGKLTGGFSSFTITFAGLAVPRLRHSRLERTHNKDHSIAYKPSKTEHQWIYGLYI